MRVFTDHLPLPDGTCLACGLRWPCHTFQKHLKAQAKGRGELMGAHMTIWYLRFLGRPEYWRFGPDVHMQVFGWIDAAVRMEQAIERAPEAVARARIEAERAARMATTGAQQAVAQARRNIKTWPQRWREWMDLRLTNGNGRPVRGTVRFGEVRDNSKVGVR